MISIGVRNYYDNLEMTGEERVMAYHIHLLLQMNS
jgi:hypothetical protein